MHDRRAIKSAAAPLTINTINSTTCVLASIWPYKKWVKNYSHKRIWRLKNKHDKRDYAVCTEHTGICLISVWHHGTSDWNFSSKTFYSNTDNTGGCLFDQLLHWSYRGQTQRQRLRCLKHLLGGYTCNNVQIHFVFTSGGLLNTRRLHIQAQHVWGTRLLCPDEKDSCFCFSSSPSLPLQQTSASHLRPPKTHACTSTCWD